MLTSCPSLLEGTCRIVSPALVLPVVLCFFFQRIGTITVTKLLLLAQLNLSTVLLCRHPEH